MRICKNCGFSNEPDAIFCKNCGRTIMVNEEERRVLTQRAPSAPAPKAKNNQSAALIISIVALVLVVIVALAMLIPKTPDITVMPTPEIEQTPVISTETEEPVDMEESFYTVRKGDVTWSEANKEALKKGGYLVSINDADEFEKVCGLAEDADINVFWVGAKRNSSSSWYDVSWLDDTDISYTRWFKGEPTYYAEDGEEEIYLMVFCVDGQWYYNDAINDVSKYYKGKIGYIIETKG